MRKLIINGIEADLPEDGVIALTKQSNNIFDFQNKRSNLSNTIKLPITDNNKDIFQDAQDIAVYSEDLRNFYDVTYIQNYEEIISKGQGKLINADDGFDFTIYWGNIDLVDILGDKTLRDLSLDDLNHVWNIENVAALNIGGNDLIYPVLNTHETEELRDGSVAEPIYAARLLPFVSLKRILEQIAIDNDIEFTGNLEDDFIDIDEVADDRYIPVTTKEYLDTDEIIQELDSVVSFPNIEEEIFEYPEKLYVGGVILDEVTIAETGTYEFSTIFNQTFSISSSGVPPTSDVSLGVNTIVVVDIFDTVLNAWKNPTYLQVLSGDYIYSQSANSVGVVGGFSTDGFVSNNLSRGFFNKGTRVRLKILSELSLPNDDYTFLYFNVENVISPPSSLNIIPQPIVEFGDTWPVVKTLPEIKQIDLLKYLAAKKCYLIDCEDGTRQFRFKKFADIVNDVIDAQDLTDNTESIKINSYHSDLGQENYLLYSNDATLGETAKGILKVNDNTLVSTNEFYVAPFSASKNEFWNSIEIGRFPCIKIWNENLEDVGARIFKLKLQEFTTNIYFTASGDNLSTDEKYIAYWSADDNFQNILDTEYIEYKNMMDNFTGVSAICLLTEDEFKQLDTLTPAYLQQYGAYFLISIVKDYVSNEKVTVDLIKL